MSYPRRIAGRLLHAVLETAIPSRCLSCRAVSSPPWCNGCEDEAALERLERACHRCGGSDAVGGHGCWGSDSPVASTVVAYRYRGVVADAVVAAKVHGAHAAWGALGARLAGAAAMDPPDVHAVTWVPTEPRRRRERGFDHAQRLAHAVAAVLARPLVPVLRAGRGAPDQGARPPGERLRLPPGVFTAQRRTPGARILLVDDVLTTGATAGAAAAALRDAGADAVHVAVLARAGSHHLGGSTAPS